MIEITCKICKKKIESQSPQETTLNGTQHLLKNHRGEFAEFMLEMATLFGKYFEVQEVGEGD